MLRYLSVLRVVIATCVCLGTFDLTAASGVEPSGPRDTPEGGSHNVVARVGYGDKDPYVLAQLEPGPFTIPSGYVAKKLIYHWSDPKSGNESDTLTAATIYSVTEGKYLKDLEKPPRSASGRRIQTRLWGDGRSRGRLDVLAEWTLTRQRRPR